MKIVIKYLKLWPAGWILACLFLLPSLLNTGIDEMQAQKLGNFLDNAFANMNDEEKQMFMEEVQREQQKLMAMSPEERAAREEQVAQELEQLMNNSPYVEWFEKPAMPQTSSEPNQLIEEVATPEEKIVKKPSTGNKPKPKTVIVSKDLKKQYKQIIQNIVQAIDSILLKTNNMQQVQHSNWNHGKWLSLNKNLQALKSELQVIINSDLTLADLLNTDQSKLQDEINSFEKIIIKYAGQLKTPDSMGLIVLFEGRPKIIDQALYDNAVIKLKAIIDAISDPAANLNNKVKALLAKHTPTDSKNNIDSKKLAASGNKTERVDLACKTNVDLPDLLAKTNKLVHNLKQCVNEQLLNLATNYQKSPNVALRRKLQWKLSELELHLSRIVKMVDSSPSCKKEILSILDSLNTHCELLHRIIAILNEIQATNELNFLIKQINAHVILLNL